ncbi:MAG TPA: transposase [Thermoanaerobaculia bacterium]|jgi:REP element-mobilizing transposase RayT
MARLLRFIPDTGSLVEVTTRTFQSRLLLTPKPQLNRIIIGTLARASRRYKVGAVAFSFLSNHYHLLLRVDDAEQLARFMGYFNSKLAREVARLTGWRQKIWSRRYQAIVISNEEAAQVARLVYVLSNSCKEGLVARLADWPGVHAAPALLAGSSLEGPGSTALRNTWPGSEERAQVPGNSRSWKLSTSCPCPAGRISHRNSIVSRSSASSRRSKRTPPPTGTAVGIRLSGLRPSGDRTRGPSPTGRRSLRRLASMPSASGCARSSTGYILSSSWPSARPLNV